jgi:hypothetical protein
MLSHKMVVYWNIPWHTGICWCTCVQARYILVFTVIWRILVCYRYILVNPKLSHMIQLVYYTILFCHVIWSNLLGRISKCYLIWLLVVPVPFRQSVPWFSGMECHTVTVYTRISQYMAGSYTGTPDAWSAHWFFRFWLQETMWSALYCALGINACMLKHQTDCHYIAHTPSSHSLSPVTFIKIKTN